MYVGARADREDDNQQERLEVEQSRLEGVIVSKGIIWTEGELRLPS